MGKEMIGRIYELSAERQIAGRRKIKLVLHEIYSSRDIWQSNGISWDETYTAQAMDSVANMSLCVEFLNEERSLPYGHGLTEIRDNIAYLEDATVVGHCEKGYIADVEIDGEMKRVLVAEGYIDEMRYPKFVAWLQEQMKTDGVKGSVEIVGRPEFKNRIIYDGGWKETGRVPQFYDYSGYAILGVKPADDAAIVMELNNKTTDTNKEDAEMDEKMKNELAQVVSDVVAELNSKWDEYYAKVLAKEAEIAQLRADIEGKEAEIAQLRADLQKYEAEAAAKEAGLSELNAKVAELNKEKKLAELNSALASFTAEEQALAQTEIDAFKADPNSIELNSITSKICVEMVRKNKEAHTSELNNAPDIFGGVASPEDKREVDIFG